MKNKLLAILLFAGFLSLSAAKTPLYKHAVTVTFKAGVSPEAIQAVDESFGRLQKLKVVKGYEWGVIDSKEQVKHIYIFSFAQPKDLETYAKSPEHQAHIKIGAEDIEGVTAVQYFVN